MEFLKEIEKPSKKEQKAAMESYEALEGALEGLFSENPEIEIEETEDKIRIPLKALKLLAQILKATSQGKPISIVPVATEMTTQAAAELLGCSRPHLVKPQDVDYSSKAFKEIFNAWFINGKGKYIPAKKLGKLYVEEVRPKGSLEGIGLEAARVHIRKAKDNDLLGMSGKGPATKYYLKGVEYSTI